MCGISGFVDKELGNKEDVLKLMMDKIIHRGPDSSGQFIDEYAGLGFRRLSIIDLEEGSQPLYNESKRYTLTFNGEIYNYQVIRQKLIDKGYVFKTHTDSEVLIHGYEEYAFHVHPGNCKSGLHTKVLVSLFGTIVSGHPPG